MIIHNYNQSIFEANLPNDNDVVAEYITVDYNRVCATRQFRCMQRANNRYYITSSLI